MNSGNYKAGYIDPALAAAEASNDTRTNAQLSAYLSKQSPK